MDLTKLIKVFIDKFRTRLYSLSYCSLLHSIWISASLPFAFWTTVFDPELFSANPSEKRPSIAIAASYDFFSFPHHMAVIPSYSSSTCCNVASPTSFQIVRFQNDVFHCISFYHLISYSISPCQESACPLPSELLTVSLLFLRSEIRFGSPTLLWIEFTYQKFFI